ncbi:hypothetical protein MSG28_001554 [Choristoneura fumiferana]|uniref:Uncharacterized protein n=1 Tax=Choristoneura fumiferana TaxID=7141 RepID=A0ACC0KUL9_CHOFU|nr:hypothetical protein MSG28_001554 [Choristoneura fumiferana]
MVVAIREDLAQDQPVARNTLKSNAGHSATQSWSLTPESQTMGLGPDDAGSPPDSSPSSSCSSSSRKRDAIASLQD